MNAPQNERASLADRGSFVLTSDDLQPRDPLEFPGYPDAVDNARLKAQGDESVVTGRAQIGGRTVELAEFRFAFMGGSMGEVAGERLARSMERAANDGVAFVLRTETGGARMQEGMRALVQMAKVTAARRSLVEAGVPFIAVLGHPTTGGVLASIAALADVTAAESGATIGFAGPRVAERFTGEPLPGDSHTATSAFVNGLVDEVVSPGDAASFVSRVLTLLEPDDPRDVDELETLDGDDDRDPWEIVTKARGEEHARNRELLSDAAEMQIELRGDRAGFDDPAVITLLARVAGRRVVIAALDRDHAPGPGGYRKARRALQIAERLRLPFITLIDTRGADPSAPSEGAGIAWEIAATFEAILNANTPVVSIVTGEGGSGGALAFAVGDRLVAFRDSFFSVIGPEGAAEILWRDGDRAADAASILKLRATDLLKLKVIDDVIDVDLGPRSLALAIANAIDAVPRSEKMVAARRERWRTR